MCLSTGRRGPARFRAARGRTSVANPTDPDGEQAQGKVDGVSLLYIAGGIPAMIAFFVLLFAFAHACDIPA